MTPSVVRTTTCLWSPASARSRSPNSLDRRSLPAPRLAAMPIPLTFKPSRGSASALERVREQARIQVEGKAAGAILYERLEPVPGFGLARLHEPSPGDIFFDLEGDPFVGESGLEYLFGYSFQGEDGQERYVGAWALSRAEERTAFEQFIDFVMDRLNSLSRPAHLSLRPV